MWYLEKRLYNNAFLGRLQKPSWWRDFWKGMWRETDLFLHPWWQNASTFLITKSRIEPVKSATMTALTANRRANQRKHFVDGLSEELTGFRTQKRRWSPPRQLQESLWNTAYTALPTSYFAAVSIKELNYI